MARSVLLALVTLFCFNCSTAASNNVRAKPSKVPHSHLEDTVHTVYYPEDTHGGYGCPNDTTTAFAIGRRLTIVGHFKNRAGKTIAHVQNDDQHFFCPAIQIPKSTTIATAFDNCCLAEKASFTFK